ncbi:tripartite tricarboxylate transporter substrate binding protein [Mesorhizobium sp. CAU 1741]|uniref:Bug family tripartite tricarboxylate transporter substrate binding protein n=1 Tax=Mesorhizobium sp. CAU 1741 TaxID=3140366 RepID=UPI00325AB081
MITRLEKLLRGAGLAAAVLAAAFPTIGAAQDEAANFPDRPVTLMVGYAAGGPSDALARIVGQRLSELWGQPVVVENRTGASGTIAAAAVSRAEPDGYTIAFGGSTTFVGFELLNPDQVTYRTLEDFDAITMIADQAMVFTARADLGVSDIKGFVDMAKEKPGELNFAMSGYGSPPHLNMELLKGMAGIDLLTVPFAGSAPSSQAMLAGTVDVMMDGPLGMGTLAKEGKAVMLGVASKERVPQLPDVPTFVEQGYDIAVKSWYGMLVPKGTPQAIIEKIDADLRVAIGDDESRDVILNAGFERVLLDPPTFLQAIKDGQATLKGLMESGAIKPE